MRQPLYQETVENPAVANTVVLAQTVPLKKLTIKEQDRAPGATTLQLSVRAGAGACEQTQGRLAGGLPGPGPLVPHTSSPSALARPQGASSLCFTSGSGRYTLAHTTADDARGRVHPRLGPGTGLRTDRTTPGCKPHVE